MIHANVESLGERVTCGVPQESILEPLIFEAMINDCHEVLYKTNTILYADGAFIYCAAKIPQDIEHILNHDLKNVEKLA